MRTLHSSQFVWRSLALAGLIAGAIPSESAIAACTPINPTNGATVTCSGAANPLAPSYASGADNLTINVQLGGSVGVLLGLGGTAMSLTGNGTTLNNSGTIDPSLLGLLSLLSSGAVIGNPNLGASIPGSTVSVTNQSTGTLRGTTGLLGLNLPDLTGMALAVRNGAGGTSTIGNAGTVGSSALLGVSLLAADAPVVAAYGKAQISFTNTGFITGRTAFEASAAGNSFVNASTISGSVSLGTNSTNTFVAVSGSSVNKGGSLGGNPLGVLGINMVFAPTGQVDGGAGGNNTLVLQNAVAGPGSGTGGPLTAAPASTYVNFQHLIVNSGTWNLQGALVSGDALLNGGLVNFDNDANFGSAQITADGGAIAAVTSGQTLNKAITVNAGGLTASGSNNFTIAGVLSGAGAVGKNGAGTLTLAAADAYAGGTAIDAGTIALGASGSLPAVGLVSLNGPGAVLDISGAGANQTIGALAGDAGSTLALGARTLTLGDDTNTTFLGTIGGTGGLVKQGTGVFTVGGANMFTGGVAINAGALAIGPGGSLAASSAIALNGAASVFDVSGASADPTIGALSGVAGSQVMLGAHTLTLGNAANQIFAGSISGVGGSLVKQGAGTLTLSGTSNYSGTTNINAGKVLAAGSDALGTGAVAVSGGTLAGSAILSNSVALSAGSVVPGDGVAVNQTLAVASYTQTAGTLVINADGASAQNAKLAVQGTAELGGTLQIHFATAPTPGQVYSVISAGALNGTFANITSSSLPAGFVLVPIYSAAGVQIRVVGPATHFGVAAPANATAGTAFAFTVTAFDQAGNMVTGYAGTVHFSSSDGSTVLPADAVLINGVGTFNATLKTAGTQTLSATDTATSSITGAANISVAAAAATHFGVSAPASASAGSALTFTVTALDAYGNTATTYAGTAHFTSSDAAAVLPANAALSNGVGSFNATLKTAGSQTLTATDTATSSITGTSAAINVAAGAATHFSVSAPANATAGTAFGFTVVALDASGNTVTSYAGSVHFSSSDSQTVLPADATLSNGTGTFSATLKTAGSQTLTAADAATPSITGTASINVAAGAATHLRVSAPVSVSSATAFTFTVTALDANDNTATSYAGSVHFATSDGSATLPADTALSNGAGTFSATLQTVGSQTLTATDTATTSITGSATIAVAEAATSMTLTASPNPAGAGQTVTLTATVSSIAPAGASVPASSAARAIAAAMPAATPTGSVQFFDGATSLGSAALDGNGVAVMTLTSPTPGSHALSAVYAGTSGFASASAQLTLVVNTPPVAAPALSMWMLVLLAAALAAAGIFHRSALTTRGWPPGI